MDADTQLRDLLRARDGHFLLESGHHGPLWLDLDGLFVRPQRVAPLADALAGRISAHDVTVVCGPLVGGALLAQLVAAQLGAASVHTERVAYVPGELHSARYDVPATLRPELRGQRVAVVDDVVNAGSASRSTVASVRAAGGVPVVLGALLRLGESAVALAARAGMGLETLAAWPSALWEPGECPRCAAGEPLT